MDSENSTTGFSKNQPRSTCKSSRKRGIAAVLQESTNIPMESKRICKTRADSKIHQLTARCAPRGNPAAGATARLALENEHPSGAPTSLYTLFKNSRGAFNRGAEILASYIQRNASYEIQKAYAVTLMATAMTSWGCNIREAASYAADCTDFNPETIRLWTSSYFTSLHQMLVEAPENVTDDDIEDELASERGHSPTYLSSLIHDEAFQLEARSFVREHAYKKGDPNLTVAAFREWIGTAYQTKVHEETARRWLAILGFSRVHHQKGVYFDGHDRDDVVQYRKDFLAKLERLDEKSVKFDNIVPQLEAEEKPLIRVVHDESTYYANCDQSYFWGDEQTNVLRQKSLGSSINGF